MLKEKKGADCVVWPLFIPLFMLHTKNKPISKGLEDQS